MQIDSEHLGVPETDFAATILLPARNFAKVVTDLGQFADSSETILHWRTHVLSSSVTSLVEFSCMFLVCMSDVFAVIIEVNPKGVKFSAKGDFGSGNVYYKSRSGETPDVEVKTDSTTTLSFASRYLTYFTKAAPLSGQVQLCLSPGQPLEVTFRLSDNDSIGTLKFYLAPKMDDSMTAE